MVESKSRVSIIFSTVVKFATFGAALGAIKSGYIAMKTGIGSDVFFMAPVIGAAFFGLIGMVAGLATAGIHKTRMENVANKEMGYFGQVVAAIIILVIIILISIDA